MNIPPLLSQLPLRLRSPPEAFNIKVEPDPMVQLPAITLKLIGIVAVVYFCMVTLTGNPVSGGLASEVAVHSAFIPKLPPVLMIRLEAAP